MLGVDSSEGNARPYLLRGPLSGAYVRGFASLLRLRCGKERDSKLWMDGDNAGAFVSQPAEKIQDACAKTGDKVI